MMFTTWGEAPICSFDRSRIQFTDQDETLQAVKSQDPFRG